MANFTAGIELCDAGVHAARDSDGGPALADFDLSPGSLGWPAIAHHHASGYAFGPEAEAVSFIHPRDVSHSFWEGLSHNASDLQTAGRVPSQSELGFHFLRDFHQRLTAKLGPPGKVAFAVPGRFLETPATEEEKIGLLLGMAGELRLPLTRIVDMACASLAGPVIREFPRGAPIIHLDVHLHAAEVSVLRHEDKLTREYYAHVPQVGYLQVFRQIKNAMGNRFLRHTAFDIHDDRRLEQAFYEQTKTFLFGTAHHAHEFLYEINTTRRSYQLIVPRTQLAADLQPYEQALVQAVLGAAKFADTPSHCAVSLSDRAARFDGLEARLRAAGFHRIVRLRPGAAAMGAAILADESPLVEDLVDVPVEIAVPLREAAQQAVAVETSVMKSGATRTRPTPSHLIVDGIGHAINGGDLTVGTGRSRSAVDVALPDRFDVAGEFVFRLVREGQHLWVELPGAVGDTTTVNGGAPTRSIVEAGDRLALRTGSVSAEILFAYCRDAHTPADSTGSAN